MVAGILITIREGLEAFLIVGILLGYLKKIGKQDSAWQVWVGALGAVGVSALAAGIIQLLSLAEFTHTGQAMFEAVVTIFAVGVLTWMVLWMQRQSKFIKGELEQKLDQALSGGQVLALASIAFFSVSREGIETALILYGAHAKLAGALLGLAISAVIAYIIFNTSIRLNLRRFFIVTGTMLIFIAAGMVSNTMTALSEAKLIGGSLTQAVWDSSRFISDNGLTGKLLHVFIGYSAQPTLVQLILYFAYLTFFGSRFYLAAKETSPIMKSEARAEAATSK